MRCGFISCQLSSLFAKWHRDSEFGVKILVADVASCIYRGADKSLARPTSRCILFVGENISFDAGLVIYINSTNILPIMIINKIY